jgi:hypothetical protein
MPTPACLERCENQFKFRPGFFLFARLLSLFLFVSFIIWHRFYWLWNWLRVPWNMCRRHLFNLNTNS